MNRVGLNGTMKKLATTCGVTDMGCDIHLFAEVKINGKWEHYGEIRFPRRYAAFGYLAGVRCPEFRAIPDRAFPTDLALMTQIHYDHWESDGHSHGYLIGEEIPKFIEWCKMELHGKGFGGDTEASFDFEWDTNCYFFGDGWSYWKDRVEDSPELKCIEDVRFIFWFDN